MHNAYIYYAFNVALLARLQVCGPSVQILRRYWRTSSVFALLKPIYAAGTVAVTAIEVRDIKRNDAEPAWIEKTEQFVGMFLGKGELDLGSSVRER
jgi:hypothetical protein